MVRIIYLIRKQLYKSHTRCPTTTTTTKLSHKQKQHIVTKSNFKDFHRDEKLLLQLMGQRPPVEVISSLQVKFQGMDYR
jgi:hypothetical protein